MARQKKTRKIGRIGVTKDSVPPKSKTTEPRKKKHTGKKPGNRNSELLKKGPTSSSSQQQKDSRIGSKKPIPLVKQAAAPKFKTPQQELDHLENDKELQRLLDKDESGVPLTGQEQRVLDEKLSRHQFLCELLGITDDDDDFEDDF